MLILLLMLGIAEARTCYPSNTTRTPYKYLSHATVETPRGCEVLCDAKSECVGFSNRDAGFSSSCVLLQSNPENEICIAETTIFLKQTVGCPVRNNLTAEFGVDPCIDEMVPIVQALNTKQICPQVKSNLYIIRAVDANGKRITFDNDAVNFLDWTGEMWLLRYYWSTYDLKVPIVAAVCARAGAAKCPCAPYKLHTAVAPPIHLPLPDTENPCGPATAQIFFQMAKVPAAWNLAVSNTPYAKIQCMAGMWIIWRQSDGNNFGVDTLACKLV